jgi:G3E family GTPase
VLCCEIRGDLVAAVDSILGQDRELDALVLEASGVAEPSGIARTFTSEVFRSPIRLAVIVAVIDAEQLPAQAEDPTTQDLVFGQIGYSDIVLLNKIDLADRARVDAVGTFVHDQLPTVRIIETSYAQVPFHVLLGIGPAETTATADHGTGGGHHHGAGAFVKGIVSATTPPQVSGTNPRLPPAHRGPTALERPCQRPCDGNIHDAADDRGCAMPNDNRPAAAVGWVSSRQAGCQIGQGASRHRNAPLQSW